MANISSDVVDYGKKLDIIRIYLSFFTNEEIADIFDCTNLTDILSRYSYTEIKARLSNYKNFFQESDVKVGSIVELKKPYLIRGVYKYLNGVVIGYRTIYTDSNRREYYRIYDVLVRLYDENNHFRYEIMHDVVENLIVSKNVIDKVVDVITDFDRYIIEVPV